MTFLIGSLLIHLAAGLASLAAPRPRQASAIGVAGAFGASFCGLPVAFSRLTLGGVETIQRAWSVPFGSFALTLDPLAALFLLPIFILGPIAALYGASYDGDEHGGDGTWLFLHALLGGMELTVLGANAVLFMIAWEVMSVSAFFLVTRNHLRPDVRAAGRTYLVAAHIGAASLMLFFLLCGRGAGSLDFTALAATTSAAPAWLLVLTAFLGFGMKAGIMPLHLWLPDAHPAAPSHVSALMSGVMIKMGVYGLLRVIPWIQPVPSWLAWFFIGSGVVSGVWGILFALAQRDLKRMLAYSSVENIGIITLGIGVGLLGRQLQNPFMAAAGFSAALLHVLNHALMKGLLFLSAGSVLHATGTTNMDRLGGIAHRMPWTAAAFLAGALAICALPPGNGFFGEFLLYLAGLRGLSESTSRAAIPMALAIGALAVIGGLAAASFTKAFGIIFLGQSRSDEAKVAHESSPAMRFAMIALVAACLASGIFAPIVLAFIAPAAAQAMTGSADRVPDALLSLPASILSAVMMSAMLLGFIAVLITLRWILLKRTSVVASGTWGCGYAAPTERMQYTASSYAQPMIFSSVLRPWIRSKRIVAPPHGFLPAAASMATKMPALLLDGFIEPILSRVADRLAPLRRFQQGHVQLYIFYIAATLMILLVWKAGR